MRTILITLSLVSFYQFISPSNTQSINCNSTTCSNGGTCLTSSAGEVVCKCRQGFVGPLCGTSNNDFCPLVSVAGSTSQSSFNLVYSLSNLTCRSKLVYQSGAAYVYYDVNSQWNRWVVGPVACSDEVANDRIFIESKNSAPYKEQGQWSEFDGSQNGQKNAQVNVTCVDVCTSNNPCQNGGNCGYWGNGSYYCTCQDGFSGLNCQISLCQDKSVDWCNGGLCTYSLNGIPANYSCQCLPGYSGLNCEKSSLPSSDASKSWLSLILLIATVIGLIAVS